MIFGPSSQAPVGQTVKQAITAFEYVPATATSPGAVKTYSFATALDFTPGQVPVRDDVVLTIAYQDADGRTVQTRKRLGTGVAGDPSASILRGLSAVNFQVDATILRWSRPRVASSRSVLQHEQRVLECVAARNAVRDAGLGDDALTEHGL
jgi:hypothetical protein